MIYGDVYLLINALCDYLILALCAQVLGTKVKAVRLLLSSALGGGFALLSLFLPKVLSTVLSFPISFLMVGIVFSFKPLKNCLLCLTVFYLDAFLVSGVVQFFSSVFSLSLPPPFSSLCLIALLLLSCFLARLFSEILRKKASVQTAELLFTYEGEVYSCSALCDSGNLLTDEITGLPVILVSPSVFRKEPVCARQIECTTVAGKESLRLIDVQSVSVDRREKGAEIALCSSPCGFGGHPALLPASLFLNNP